jgi:hypothetical protein
VSILILEEPLKGEGKGHTITGHEDLEGGYNSILSLTLAVDGVGGQRHAPAALPPGKTGVTCTGGWVDLRVVWTATKNLVHHQESIPGLSIP